MLDYSSESALALADIERIHATPEDFEALAFEWQKRYAFLASLSYSTTMMDYDFAV